MMYQSKFAVAVRVNGKVLREQKENVFIPFGSEFSLLLKNLNSVRAIAKVWIDGDDVTEGTTGLIVPPNDSIDLERYIKKGNLSEGNRFKFIERTARISEHRGNRIDDGLIRVEFEFERQPNVFPYLYPYNTWTTTVSNGPLYNTNSAGSDVPMQGTSSGPYGSSISSTSWTADSAQVTANSTSPFRGLKSEVVANVAQSAASVAQNDVGITVPGSHSTQQFTYGAWFPTDGVKHSIVLHMLGEVQGHQVMEPVTVHAKPTCQTCGRVNKATSKFCTECGTSLNVVSSHTAYI